jgi:OFA family oxalate/formate antiporter-like MFS transporter
VEAWSASDALRTSSLWATCWGVSLIALFSMGVWFHLVRIMADAGVPEDRLGTVFLTQTVGQMLGKFVFSALLDRLSVRTVLSAAMVVQLGAIGCFVGALQLMQPMLAVAGVALQAAALGGAYSVDGVSYAKFFGRDNLGAITGTTKAVWQVATAIGATPMGAVRDSVGTFLPAFEAAVPLFALSFVVVWRWALLPDRDGAAISCCREKVRVHPAT